MKLRLLFIFTIASFACLPQSTCAQFLGIGPTITFDPTQAAHVISQIAKAEKLYTTTVQTTQNVISAYNLAKQMATSPQSLYSGYGSGLPTWVPIIPSNDTYGNTGAWINSFNKNLSSATTAVQTASVARIAKLSGYDQLSVQNQKVLAAKTATLDLGDSVSATNLSAIGSIRAAQVQRQQDIANLETASHSLDSTQHTELATLQRINQALLLLLRTQQDQSQLAQGLTMQQMVEQKQVEDEMKMLMQISNGYEVAYKLVAPSASTSDISKALH